MTLGIDELYRAAGRAQVDSIARAATGKSLIFVKTVQDIACSGILLSNK
jgi:hypothetical protein